MRYMNMQLIVVILFYTKLCVYGIYFFGVDLCLWGIEKEPM